MNRVIFEGRFLVNVAGSIIRQDNLYPLRSGQDWERMFRTADYHKIANLIYLGLLGNTKMVSMHWRHRFFERYQEALHFGEICMNAEKELLALFDMKGIPCVVLSSCGIRNLYKIPETAGNSPLRLFLGPERYSLAKGYLIDLGYETDRLYPDCGERMSKVSGFSVEIYQKFPFETKAYKKNMQYLMEHSYLKESYRCIKVMSAEDRFIYRMAEAVYRYVTDELLIREVMDLYLYHKAWNSQLNKEYIHYRLSALQIEDLAEKLLYIGYMWFGTKEDSGIPALHEDMGIYDVLENRILSRGELSKETNPQALELTRLIQRERAREKRRTRVEHVKKQIDKRWKGFMRIFGWICPEYKYMCAIYPWLERLPVFLPVGWMMRGTRMLAGMLTHRNSKF